MRASDFETVLPDAPLSALPVSLVEKPSRSGPFLLIALAAPAAVLCLVPLVLVANHAVRDWSFLWERSQASLSMAAALACWIAVFGWPIADRASRVGLTRRISIAQGRVMVTDEGLFGSSSWSEPVAAYDGLLHRVRSSLSGTRHELILRHANPSRSVLVRVAPRIGQMEIDIAAKALGCREVGPQLFSVSPQERHLSVATAT